MQGEAKVAHFANGSACRLAATRRSSGTARLRARSSHHRQRQNSRRTLDECHGFDVGVSRRMCNGSVCRATGTSSSGFTFDFKALTVLPWWQPEPALERTKEVAFIDKAEHVGHLTQRDAVLGHVLAGQLPASLIEKLLERSPLCVQTALQSAVRQCQAAGNVLAARLASMQPPDDFGADPVAETGVPKTGQPLLHHAF